MSYEIKILNKDYNADLLELSKTRNTGSTLFSTDRGPDFFALAREFGDPTYFGILKQEKLIGGIGAAKQIRIINGSPEPVLYLFDLKVDPAWSGKPPFYRLVQYVLAHYRNVEKVNWGFATILDTNQNKSSITKGAGLYPEATFLGKNYHIGYPLFLPLYRKTKGEIVKEIDSTTAWEFYSDQAKYTNFAPVNREIFIKENGFFLGCFRGNEFVAVAKIIDQSGARKIFLTRQPPLYFRVLNLFCRIFGYAPLPKENEVFHHAYLSYYAADGNKDYSNSFMNFMQKNQSQNYSYVFAGMTEMKSRKLTNPLLLRFTSFNFGYGAVPAGLKVDFVELTLI